MRAQCLHHIHGGARFGAQQFPFPFPGEPSSPAERLPSDFAAWSRRVRLEQDLPGVARTHGSSVATPLQGPVVASGSRQNPFSPACGCPSPLFYSRRPPPSRRRSSGRNLQLADFCLATDVYEEDTEMADPQMDNAASVYLYVPNIIGYMRVLTNFVAFTLCFTNKKFFVVLYFISFVCDGLDGWFARKLNQVSTFGAALDMVTDRVSTSCLLVILSHIYSPGLIFLLLLALDIASHWLQMYSTFLSGKASHKDVKDSAHWLLKAYYRNRLIMGFCCIGSEVVYTTLFLIAKKKPENISGVIVNTMKWRPLSLAPLLFALLGWATKQAVNVLQMKMAADTCVSYDMTKRS